MEKMGIDRLGIVSGLIVLINILVLVAPVSAADLRIVANTGAPEVAMDPKTVKDVFLGKKSTWSDGSPIEFVVLDGGNVHKSFIKVFVNKTPSQYSIFWKKQVFTGKGSTPKSFASEEELLAFVAGKSGALGYVSGNADVSSVKILNEK